MASKKNICCHPTPTLPGTRTYNMIFRMKLNSTSYISTCAFDSVPHQKLTAKFQEETKKIIVTYMSCRKQNVKTNNESSSTRKVTSGLPQVFEIRPIVIHHIQK